MLPSVPARPSQEMNANAKAKKCKILNGQRES